MSARTKQRKIRDESSLEDQLLLAMPTMPDKRFRKSVIYMCRHSPAGAMGIIVNQRVTSLSLAELLRQLDLLEPDDPATMPADLGSRPVHIGGPVSSERGFVLHTSDFVIDDATLIGESGICLTATIEMLKAIAAGKGPHRSILALGYAGWDAGQLEGEIQANGWLHCPAERDLVFASEISETYDRALLAIGVDPAFLVGEAGHA